MISTENPHGVGQLRNQTGETTQVSEAVTLEPWQQVVEISATGAYDITLPPLASCPGAIFLFYRPAAGTGTVGLVDQDDGIVAVADVDLTAAADTYAVLQNVAGRLWVVVESKLS